MTSVREYTVFSFFCGSGGKTLGAQRARMSLLVVEGRFRSLGGVDFDELACRDFERLTGSRAFRRDIANLTQADLLEMVPECPDVILMSPPCKGFSRLITQEKSREAKYVAMNLLAEKTIALLTTAWAPRVPRLVLFENVPPVVTRGAAMLRRIRSTLHKAGYVSHGAAYDAGELGGLAQTRPRYLMVARHAPTTQALLYQPPRRRLRGVGEVLGKLPMPGDPAAGPMHALPRMSWLTAVRLAMIPAGGDWRDLPGVLAPGEARRSKFRRHGVERWDAPCPTVTGSGGHAVNNVADPRIPCRSGYDRAYAVIPWDAPSNTVAGQAHPGQGTYSVADPRLPVTPLMTVAEANERLKRMSDVEAKRLADVTPLIVADDGTWHRPLTTRELAALQDFPTEVDGAPLVLAGSTTQQRQHIGNAVPPAAAQAIAEKQLATLLASDLGGFVLDGTGSVWVAPGRRASLGSVATSESRTTK